MGKRERMSSVDTAWLRMDSQANLMLIVGVYEFEGKVDYDRLRRLSRKGCCSTTASAAVSRRTRPATRGSRRQLRSRPPPRAQALPGAGSSADLKRLVGRLASTALDASRPLWQMHLVDNYNGGQALIIRIHHCIADGIALIGVLLALTSDDPAEAAPNRPPYASRQPARGAWDAVLRPLPRRP